MKHYAGLDISLEETAIGILDETGRIVPVGARGQALSLRVQSLRDEPARSRSRLGRLALLTPSYGGLGADREEKRVTHGNNRSEADHQEQLDRNNPNQRGS